MAGFLKKNWQKDAGDTAINAGLRIVGAGTSAFILNKFFNGEPRDGVTDKKAASNTAITLRNIAGPGMLAIGVLGDMMLEDEKLRSLCQGITVYSALHSIAVVAPDLSTSMGVAETTSQRQAVSGLGEVKTGINALGTTTRVENPLGRLPRHDRKPMALGATNENYSGNYPEELAMAAGQKTTVDTDGKTFNNDWAYLAANIDNADAITKSLGDADEEAAQLMGVTTPAEAALLMGMF